MIKENILAKNEEKKVEKKEEGYFDDDLDDENNQKIYLRVMKRLEKTLGIRLLLPHLQNFFFLHHSFVILYLNTINYSYLFSHFDFLQKLYHLYINILIYLMKYLNHLLSFLYYKH